MKFRFFHVYLLSLCGVSLSVSPVFAANEINYTPHIVALQKFQNKDYAAAVEAIKPLLSQKGVPAELFWNAGTYGFYNGDYVFAAIHWEEAVRLGLKKWNAAEWVFKARKEFIHSPQSIEPSAGSDFLVALVPYSLVWGLIFSGLLFLGAVFKPSLRLGAITLGIFLLIPALLAYYFTPAKIAFSYSDSTKLFAGKGEDFPEIAELKKGDRLMVIDVQADWIKIKTRQGAMLWGQKNNFIIVE